ncbi:polysaccharide biosynthesis/export family protein [Pseudolabrys taiwanensis]
MRTAKLLLPILFALAAAGCARQQQTYYIIDPQTGQPVPVVAQQAQPYGPQGQYAQQSYEQQPAYEAAAPQPQYAPQPYQQQYAQAPAAPPSGSSARGLFSRSPAYAQQSYQTYQQPAYAPPPAAPTRSASGRGFFTSGRPVYQQPAPQYSGGPYVAAPPAAAYAAAPSTYPMAYTLDSGDKLRVVVFGQEGITNSYIVGVDGNINLPLIGGVQARGHTTQQLSQTITARLKQGYVREPHVSVEVETYRPFFILGEVTTPGQYPYVPNMSAETAIAIAGGFSPRASKRTVELTRNAPGQQFKGEVPLNYPLRPGDTILVKERWF